MQKIVAHCLVKNEERFIKYSLMSALNYVDEIMVWDTGSTDETKCLISNVQCSMNGKKIKFREAGDVDAVSFTEMRNKMLMETSKEFDWLMILDGDEIWPVKSIKTVIQYINSHPETESIVVRTHNLVGDIYHKMPESSGHYHLAGQAGHLNLRFINLRKIPGLNVQKPHGQQGYYDGDGTLVQDREPKKIKFLDVHYAHATHLQRSNSRDNDLMVIKRGLKMKYEWGERIAQADIPEVLLNNTNFTQAPLDFWIKAAIFTWPRRLKRWLFPAKDGY